MKRFPLREFLWLCAPVAAIGAGFIAVRLLHPPRDPDAVIVLNVTSDSDPHPDSLPLQPTLSFEWKAAASGGPQNEIQMLYSQKLVASGDGHSRVVFQEPALPGAAGAAFNIGTGSGASPAFQQQSQNFSVLYEDLPIWTKKLEWRGEFVAAPHPAGTSSVSGVGAPSTFAGLARIKGAARASKTFLVRFDADEVGPFRELRTEKVSPVNAYLGADTCVTTQFRDNPRRFYARLVAFDGTTKRQLWSDTNEIGNPYFVTNKAGYSELTRSDANFFRLRDVPAQWGEVIFLLDTAIDPTPGKVGIDSKSVALAEIARLKKAGWQTDSRRLTVRKKGAKIIPPNYSATPNTQFLDVQTSSSKTDWIVNARLRYNGPIDSEDALDAPFGANFFDAQGKYFSVSATSFEIVKSRKPREYTAKIVVPLKDLGRKRPTAMKIVIADNHAMPLLLQTKLQVPTAPR